MFEIDVKAASDKELQMVIRRLERAIEAFGPYDPLNNQGKDKVDELETRLDLCKQELQRREETL